MRHAYLYECTDTNYRSFCSQSLYGLLCSSMIVGYETYNDDYDEARPSDLLNWLRSHPESCNNVDIVCPQRTLSKIYRAPYTEATSTPWEIKVTRGPDGVCYLSEG